jgi:hypothetical protein
MSTKKDKIAKALDGISYDDLTSPKPASKAGKPSSKKEASKSIDGYSFEKKFNHGLIDVIVGEPAEQVTSIITAVDKKQSGVIDGTLWFVEEVKEGRSSRFNERLPLQLKGKTFSSDGITIEVLSVNFRDTSNQETDSGSDHQYINYYYDFTYKVSYPKQKKAIQYKPIPYDLKITGKYTFEAADGLKYNFTVVGSERQNDTEDALSFMSNDVEAKKALGTIIVKNSAIKRLAKGETISAVSSTGIKGKITANKVESWIKSYKKPLKTSDVSEFLNATKDDGHEYSLWNKEVGITFAYNGRLFSNDGKVRPNGTTVDLAEAMGYWESQKIDTLFVDDRRLVILPEKQDKYNCYTTGYDGMINHYGNEYNITLEEAVDFCWHYDDVRRSYETKEQLEKDIKEIPSGKQNIIASSNITGVVVSKSSTQDYAKGGSILGGDGYQTKKELYEDYKRIIHAPKLLNIYESSDTTLVGKTVKIKLPNEAKEFRTKVSAEYATMIKGSGKYGKLYEKDFIVEIFADGGEVGGDISLSINAKNVLKLIEGMYPKTLSIDTTTPSKDNNKAIVELEEKGLVKRISYNRGFAEYGLTSSEYAKGGEVGRFAKEIQVIAIDQSGTRGYEIYDTQTNNRAINTDGSYEFDDSQISEIIGEKNMDTFYEGQDKFKPKRKLNFDIFAKGGEVKDDLLTAQHKKFAYMMLSRLQGDNDYFLGAGQRHEKHLWAGNVDAQIAEMKRVWNMIPKGKKPEWLSMDDIFEYEKKMKTPSSNEPGQECYIEYLNKEKGFKKDVKNFSSHEEAVKWAKENFEKFDPDMIHYKMANGGAIYLNKEDGWIYTPGKNSKGLWTVFGELPGEVEKRDEYPEVGLSSEEDAILVAKGMAGLTPEFAKGGEVGGYKVVYDKGNPESATIFTPIYHNVFSDGIKPNTALQVSVKELYKGAYMFAKYGLVQFIIYAADIKKAVKLGIERLKTIFRNGYPNKNNDIFKVTGVRFNEKNETEEHTLSFMLNTNTKTPFTKESYETDKGDLLKYDTDGGGLSEGYGFWYVVDKNGPRLNQRLKGPTFLSMLSNGMIAKNDVSMAKGGNINPLEKELHRLQRDLNSNRLSTYTEGDTSEAQLALNKEREVKLARFNEVLELLRANNTKGFAKGGEIGFKKAVAFPEALDYLYYVIEEFPDTYVAVNIEHVDAWKTHDAATRYHYYEEVLLKSEMVVVEDYENKEFKKGGEIDKVTMDVPFLIRAMEYSKEEAPDDIDLHKKAEKIIKASQGNRTLEMEDYNTIFADGGEVEKNPVPMEIYKQIGRRAFLMLGAKNIVSHSKENALSFRIRGSNKANYIKVTLNSMDTYDVEYGKIRGDKYHVVAEDKGIYDDMLLKSIENNTGLYTKLFGKGGDLKPVHKQFDMVYKETESGNKIGKIMEVIDGENEIKYKVLYHHPFQEIADESENDIYPYQG